MHATFRRSGSASSAHRPWPWHSRPRLRGRALDSAWPFGVLSNRQPLPDGFIGHHVRRRTMLYDSPLLHHVTGTANSSRTADVLLHRQQCDTSLAWVGRALVTFGNSRGGVACGRLLQRKGLRRSREGCAGRYHLLFPAGKRLAELATLLAPARE